jgi:NitT/TauT family transport system substrate-binding protein
LEFLPVEGTVAKRTTRAHRLGLAIFVATLSPLPAPAQDKPLTKVVFSLDINPQGRHAPWYAALAEGYYKEEGLDVTIIPSGGGAQSIQNVESDTATMGFMAIPGLALARAAGAKIKLVAINYQKMPIAVFSLNPGANVTSAKQLEGLTLGSGSGSATPQILRGYMAQQGLDPDKLQIVDINPSARAGALLTKKIPSIEFFVMSKGGLTAAAKDSGLELQTFLPGDHGLELYSNGIGVKEDYLAKNPQVVRGFVRAALRGWTFAFEHPDKAADDEIKYIPSLKPDSIKAEIEIIRALSVTADTQKHGLGWFDPARIKNDLDFTVKYIGTTGTPPKAADLYADGFLPNPPVKP